MNKNCATIFAVLLAAASVSVAQNAIPYQDTYENYDAGSNLVGAVWQGNESASAIATNLTYTKPAGVSYPVTNAAHTKVMAFTEGVITNELDGSGLTLVAIDTMIQPVFAEPPTSEMMAAVSNAQLSAYVDTNGFITVFHGVFSEGEPIGGSIPTSWAWSTLSNGVSALTAGEWMRLTVTMKYIDGDDYTGGVWFKVTKDGVDLTSPAAFTSTDTQTSLGGSWFVATSWDVSKKLHRLVLSGSANLDDLVVTTNALSYAAGDPETATNGVPILWMQTSGLTTNTTYPTWDALALGDSDNDGASTWAEYYAGTNPSNEFSKLVIISSTFSNGSPVLKWIGTTNAQSPYLVQWSSNLMNISAWTTITNNLTRSEGTNEVTLPQPVGSPAFLRVNVPTGD